MMKILYIHGWGSEFDQNSQKITHLNTIGEVCGITLDYTLPHTDIAKALGAYIISEQVDILVGTSLGGFWANQLGDQYGVPFVAINPCVDPKNSLRKYVGQAVDYTGKPYFLSDNVVKDYPDFVQKGCGLILIDEADDVIDHSLYSNEVQNFQVERFSGGNHRFAHMEESLPLIKEHFDIAEMVYGFN